MTKGINKIQREKREGLILSEEDKTRLKEFNKNRYQKSKSKEVIPITESTNTKQEKTPETISIKENKDFCFTLSDRSDLDKEKVKNILIEYFTTHFPNNPFYGVVGEEFFNDG